MINPLINGVWRLPFDVMCNVLAASQHSTISALMKSCHALYTEGPRHLLHDGVELDSAQQITLFADFMLTEDPSRFAYMRKLGLSIQSPVNLSAQLRLCVLLGHPSLALETLILQYAETLLGDGVFPLLHEALGRLKTVKNLVALRVQRRSAAVIKSLPSKLKSISIAVDVPIEWPFDVLSTLKPFSDTLQTLQINSEPSLRILSLLIDDGCCHFPRVRTFGIVYRDLVPALLASPAFARAFPGITHLKLIPLDLPGTPHRYQSLTSTTLERVIQSRERHRAWRSQPGDGVLPSLSSLVECSGGLFAVYALALDHPLLTLRLWQHIEADDLPTLREVLEDTRPRHLYLSTTIGNIPQVFATLRTLQTHTPPRIDLNISLAWSFWCNRLSEQTLERFHSLLKSSFPPLSAGLAELHLLFANPVTARPANKSAVSDALKAFTRWALEAAPSLILTCSISADEAWRWPDLGQDDDEFSPGRMRWN
ncbi:hypothetical protein LXA43DRAFT_595566 [Ganoderma leucocontextum]|nr:hypothetical protein LXA43DRAFT_595566 [Ganoderma leucocontextum]